MVSEALKIGIFSRTFSPAVGGLEGMALGLARQFAALGHHVVVVTDVPPPPLNEEAYPFRVLRTTSAIARVRQFRDLDVVLHMNFSIYGYIASKIARVRSVYSHHSCYMAPSGIPRAIERIKRRLMRSETSICCSKYVQSELKLKGQTIPSAYDMAVFGMHPARSPSKDFVFCARLVSDKGGDVILRAFASLIGKFPDATLTVIGDGPERSVLERTARSLGVASRVEFLGILRGDALVIEMRSHWCALIPSLWEEPFGIAALEGLACCSYVIASNRGGLSEALGGNGILVMPTPQAFGAAMREILAIPKSASVATIDYSAREAHLKSHDIGEIAKRYLSVLLGATQARAV
jgi:glycogen synthase